MCSRGSWRTHPRLHSQAKAKLAELKARYGEHTELCCEYRKLQETQDKILAEFNKDTPGDVFKGFPASRNQWKGVEFATPFCSVWRGSGSFELL